MSYSFLKTYSIDTREIIDGYRKVKARKGLETLIKASQLKTPPSVIDEISRVEDDVYQWVKRWESQIIMELSESGLAYVEYLVNRYRNAFHGSENPGIRSVYPCIRGC